MDVYPISITLKYIFFYLSFEQSGRYVKWETACSKNNDWSLLFHKCYITWLSVRIKLWVGCLFQQPNKINYRFNQEYIVFSMEESLKFNCSVLELRIIRCSLPYECLCVYSTNIVNTVTLSFQVVVTNERYTSSARATKTSTLFC